MKRRILEHYNNQCSDCGVTNEHISFFDLHHVNPNTKEVRNTRILAWSWERVVRELENCVLVCPSCHRLRHIQLGDYSDMEFYETIVDSEG